MQKGYGGKCTGQKKKLTSLELQIKKQELNIKKEEKRIKEEKNIKNAKLKRNKNIRIYKYKVGDKVRITTRREKFQREYDTRWTGEIFKISRRFYRQGEPIYNIEDWFDDTVLGTFYTRELQKVEIDENKQWKIEKIVKKRKKGQELLVKWLFWPKKFNSWISKQEYKTYK